MPDEHTPFRTGFLGPRDDHSAAWSICSSPFASLRVHSGVGTSASGTPEPVNSTNAQSSWGLDGGGGCPPPVRSSLLLLYQAEIVKRLSAICAQMVPFLTQEVSVQSLGGREGVLGLGKHWLRVRTRDFLLFICPCVHI